MISLKGFEQRKPAWEQLNKITERLSKKDATIWGESASAEASIRLGWVDLPETSRDLLPTLDSLSAWSRELGHKHFILCGMGGSSLAPEVIAATYKKSLTVLDSTEPTQIEMVAEIDLRSTCIIISSKSGSTVETASQKSFLVKKLMDLGLDPKNHFVVVTDPGSPLEVESRGEGLKVITADPNVGGRFSALSAFGLTPAALIGVDVSVLLDDALAASKTFTEPNSSVVRMAALLAEPTFAFTGFYDRDSELVGISDWIEQLIAESTGKDGKGVLPVVIDSYQSNLYPVIGFSDAHNYSVLGPLGAQFIFWEWVTALLSYLLEVDPFNQPNVTESKDRTNSLLKIWSEKEIEIYQPIFTSGSVEVFSATKLNSLSEYLREFAGHQYIAVMAYLNRISDQSLAEIRSIIESRTRKVTTFGWGPRFLHSTGQFHKGGPTSGSFIQITTSQLPELEIPGREFTFGTLLMAQALGDNEALTSRGFPILRLNLKDRKTGIAELLQAAKEI